MSTSPPPLARPVADAAVVIPAYNEGKVIRQVVEDVRRAFGTVVVVDDASRDDTAAQARAGGALVLRHALNLGQGGALETGIRYALSLPHARYFVTFDADGQHDVEDALRMVDRLRVGDVEVVLGSRFLGGEGPEGVPAAKRLLLRVATVVNNRLSGTRLTDAHNGLRAFGRQFAQLVRLQHLDMAHASEVTMILSGSGLPHCEVPVSVRYTEYSRGKGQRAVNSVNIMFDLVLARTGRRR